MNIEKVVFNKINKSYQGFKMLDAFLFDADFKKFKSINLRIENIAQLQELIKIVKQCKNHNLIAFEEILKNLEDDLLFYKKALSAYFKDSENMKNFINESFEKIFIVAYKENKDFILTSNEELPLFIKNTKQKEKQFSLLEKSEVLTSLLNLISSTNKTKLNLDLKNNFEIISTLVEIINLM
ncbi:hypothetical protein CG002_03180 [Mesoplasma florum]|uniref:hypothetical protein n=1 Tax=Mesoplasma florum TaxID=2151 RepID=UPI000D09788D|nr:hypothetical protein [Mesoplasma florum]AVN65340.1 hypothetical protein CG002_03180 [Mesoplasma florum]